MQRLPLAAMSLVLLAGCSSAPADGLPGADPSGTPEEIAPPAPVATDPDAVLDWTTTILTFDLGVTCHLVGGTLGCSSSSFLADATGIAGLGPHCLLFERGRETLLRSLSATASWDAQSPFAEELRLRILEPENRLDGEARGPSPLAAANGTGAASADVLWVLLQPVHDPGAVAAQAVRVEVTLVHTGPVPEWTTAACSASG